MYYVHMCLAVYVCIDFVCACVFVYRFIRKDNTNVYLYTMYPINLCTYAHTHTHTHTGMLTHT